MKTLLACALAVLLFPVELQAQHEFDFHIGTWTTHVRRLVKPLTGSTTWVEMKGTTLVRKVFDGRANLVELVADGGGVHFEGLSLRLYNPEARQWSLHFANAANGILDKPTIGSFKNGRGEFYAQETLNGRAILVRFVISDITPKSVRFEQAFGGWRKDVGGELGRDGHAGGHALNSRNACFPHHRAVASSDVAC